MSADIFISFASQDAKIANTISAAIESRGFKCWISSRDILPGENFQSAIVRAIRTSRILLLVFTGNSNRSDEMTKELALASQQRLMVVPLRVEDVTPSDAFAYEFATRQWIDLFADWELAMNQLCARLGAALANEPHPTEPIVLGKPAPQAEAPRPLPPVVSAPAAIPARAAPRAATPPGGKAAAAPRTPVLKVAIGAAALVAAVAIAVPALMRRPAAGVAPPAAPRASANAAQPTAESAVVVAAAPSAVAAAADAPAAAPDAAAVAASASAPGSVAAAPSAPAVASPGAAVAGLSAATGGDATGKDAAKDPPKPVERKKRVPQPPQQKSSSNLPY